MMSNTQLIELLEDEPPQIQAEIIRINTSSAVGTSSGSAGPDHCRLAWPAQFVPDEPAARHHPIVSSRGHVHRLMTDAAACRSVPPAAVDTTRLRLSQTSQHRGKRPHDLRGCHRLCGEVPRRRWRWRDRHWCACCDGTGNSPHGPARARLRPIREN